MPDLEPDELELDSIIDKVLELDSFQEEIPDDIELNSIIDRTLELDSFIVRRLV